MEYCFWTFCHLSLNDSVSRLVHWAHNSPSFYFPIVNTKIFQIQLPLFTIYWVSYEHCNYLESTRVPTSHFSHRREFCVSSGFLVRTLCSIYEGNYSSEMCCLTFSPKIYEIPNVLTVFRFVLCYLCFREYIFSADAGQHPKNQIKTCFKTKIPNPVPRNVAKMLAHQVTEIQVSWSMEYA